MVNLDDIKTGDTLVVEVAAFVYGNGTIEMDCGTVSIRDYCGDVNDDIRVLSHQPKAIDEPTGLGAVVKVKGNNTGLEKYIVRVSATDSLWAFTLYPGEPHNWSSIVATHDMVEVVSPGVDTN